MNEFLKLIRDSEINTAKHIDSLSDQKQTFYRDVKRRSIFCSLFHKKQIAHSEHFNMKQLYTCPKCRVIWNKYKKLLKSKNK